MENQNSKMNFFNPQPKPEPRVKTPYKGIKKTAIKQTITSPSGKREFFRDIFNKCGGLCMITEKPFPMNNSYSYMHVLSHGGYDRFEFYEKNVLFVNPRIHVLYDCNDKEGLLKEFPEAAWIYDLKEILKMEYNNLPTI